MKENVMAVSPAGKRTCTTGRTCVVCGAPLTSTHKLVVTCSDKCHRRRKSQQVIASQRNALQKRKSVTADALWGEEEEAVLQPPAAAETIFDKVAGLPEDNVPLCKAVELALDTPAAIKLGVFYLLVFSARDYKVFIPRADNGLPDGGTKKVAFVVRLNPAGRWGMRTPEQDAKQNPKG